MGALVTIVIALSVRSPEHRVSAQVQADGISPTAVAQIEALLAEKATRPPSQRKMDSQLVYAAKMARGETIAAGVATLDVGIPASAAGLVDVDIRAEVNDPFLAQVRALGVDVLETSVEYRSVVARASLAQVERLAELPDTIYIQPKPEAMTNAGSRQSEGDATHKAANARSAHPAFDGTGVRVCVISNGVSSLASSQALGDLGPVTILPGQTGSGDEGTAMLEIVRDLAPGAQLYFATGFTSITQFATNIKALRAAGCDIILDDIGYFVESVFQDGQNPSVTSPTNGGIVTQAVKDVAASGALYFSSAGNSGNLDSGTSGTWEGDFVNGGAGSLFLETCPGGCQLHNFGGLLYDTVTSSSRPYLFWADPLGGSGNDYDLFRLNSTGTVVLGASTGVQSGAQDPLETIFAPANPGDRLVILKYSGGGRFLHLDTNRGRLSVATAGNTHAHAATTAPNAFGVAATPARGPYPNSFNAGNRVETFSSDGPRRIFFNENGAAFTPGNLSSSGGQLLNKPDITAADGVTVTGVGGFPSPFFGTSAAAPHAAAIAALVKSANPSATASQIRAALVGSAIDIHAGGIDRDSGVGIIMADTAVEAIAPASPPSITSHPPSQTIPFGQAASLSVTATGSGLSYQWYAGFSGVTASPVGSNSSIYTTAALVTTKKYWVRVSNAAGSVNSNTAQITVAFTDDGVSPGVTVIKAVHLTELRTRVNEVRARYGLAPYPFAQPVTAGVTVVRTEQVTELRTALAQAYAAAGRTAPAYTDANLAVGNPVRAVHLTELRAAVTALE